MAGMLAGVETARRRRIHQTSSSSSGPLLGIGSSPSSRRSSLSLLCPSSSSWQRNSSAQGDEKLGQLAREAKRRLDERLRAQRKSQIPRNNSDVSEEIRGGRMEEKRELRTEVFGGWKKNGGSSNSKRLIGSWAKLGWKQWEQEECAVCLEEFKVGENLVNLPCAHRFHSRCLLPWLQTSSHCPCCRTFIFPSEHE